MMIARKNVRGDNWLLRIEVERGKRIASGIIIGSEAAVDDGPQLPGVDAWSRPPVEIRKNVKKAN